MTPAPSPARTAAMRGAMRAVPFMLALVLLLAAALLPCGARATNAPIAWSAVQAESGAASDIITAGRLVAAITFGTPGSVNNVAFSPTSPDISLSGEAGVLSPVSSYAALSYDPAQFVGWAPGYAALLSGAAFGHGSGMMLTLSGLTDGQSYLVELLETPWDANWTTSFSDGTNSSAPLMVFGSSVAAPTISTQTDYVSGVFTARSNQESIYASGPYSDTLLGAVQLRAVPHPVGEPDGVALFLTGLAGLGWCRRARR